jgi:hypothetical protein
MRAARRGVAPYHMTRSRMTILAIYGFTARLTNGLPFSVKRHG